MTFVRRFGRFWYDFLVGDDWRIAAGVVAALVVGAIVVRAGIAGDTVVTLAGLGVILAGLVVSLVRAPERTRG